MQLFLLGYLIVSICEIFTVGGFPLGRRARIVRRPSAPSHLTTITDPFCDLLQVFTAIHLGAITATFWILLLNAVVGFQLLDDGTPISIGLLLLSATALFVGTGYIALDTGFSWTDYFDSSRVDLNRNTGLYVLYQLMPLVFLAGFLVLESILVLRVLGERKPMRKMNLP